MTNLEMLAVARAQAEQGAAEGGVPIGAALFDADGRLLGRGRNRRVQRNDPAMHAEVDAFRDAGRVGDYTGATLATTLAPCWYCSGLIRQFAIGRVVVGADRGFGHGLGWLREAGVDVVVLDDDHCAELLDRFATAHPALWQENIDGARDHAPAMPGVRLLDHPLAQTALTVLRSGATGAAAFRDHSARLAALLTAEALREVDTEVTTVETPLGTARGHQLAQPLCLVPVLRAGLALLEPARELVPDAAVGFIGLERDETTAVAHAYYRKLPERLGAHHVLLLDPMLATGGSMVDAVHALRAAGAITITVVCVVAAPEGLARLLAAAPGIRVITAAIDDSLDANAYIVPGLGDYGDRYFGT